MKFAVEELSVWYGRTPIVDCVSADFSACSISALIGASRPEQIVENVGALSAPPLTPEELARIDQILSMEG